jgi:segregation and condensation protein A
MNTSAMNTDDDAAAASGLARDEGDGRTPLLTFDGFSGPLERLLSLARAQQIDLAQLPLASLVDQLVAALQQAPPATPLGQKGDWVVMAAWLVQLRSLLLLPATAPARLAGEVEAEQLRTRLIDLHAMQAVAAWLAQRPQLGHDVFARGQPELFGVTVGNPPALDGIEFLWASLALFDDDLPDADTTTRYQPRWWDLHTIADARVRILRLLADSPAGRLLDTLLPEADDGVERVTPAELRRRSARASTFVASLELTKQGDVVLGQEDFLSPLHVSSAPAPARDNGGATGRPEATAAKPD